MQALQGLDRPPFLGAIPKELSLEQVAAGKLPPWHILLIVDPSGSGNWRIMPGLLQTLTFGDRCNGCGAACRSIINITQPRATLTVLYADACTSLSEASDSRGQP